VLAQVVSTFRSVIDLPTAWGKTFLIELLCKMYTQRILIVTTRISVLHDIFRRVKAAVPHKRVHMTGDGKRHGPDAEIIVCSSGSLHHIDGDWPEILLFDEVHHAAAPEVFEELTKFQDCRMLGLSASPEDRADNADLLIEAWFGPCSCRITYQEAVDTGTVVPLAVYMLPVGGTYIPKKNDIARDRHNLWRNNIRNRLIAEAARIFSNEQVMIMTSTVEHALYIKQLLPDFELAHGGISKERRDEFVGLGIMKVDDDLMADKESIKERMRAGTLNKVISTSTFREGVDLPKLSVLIRADGQGGTIPSIQMGGRLSRLSDGKTEGILIDLLDDFEERYINRAKKRMRIYRSQRWKVTNLPNTAALKLL
jgi:superfamily II DNA or RNA helicase